MSELFRLFDLCLRLVSMVRCWTKLMLYGDDMNRYIFGPSRCSVNSAKIYLWHPWKFKIGLFVFYHLSNVYPLLRRPQYSLEIFVSAFRCNVSYYHYFGAVIIQVYKSYFIVFGSHSGSCLN